jgi:anti-anti-sigma regulatory factor
MVRGGHVSEDWGDGTIRIHGNFDGIRSDAFQEDVKKKKEEEEPEKKGEDG